MNIFDRIALFISRTISIITLPIVWPLALGDYISMKCTTHRTSEIWTTVSIVIQIIWVLAIFSLILFAGFIF